MAPPEDTGLVPPVCAVLNTERDERGESFATLATHLGVSPSSAQRLCQIQEPKLDQLALVEAAYNLPRGYFVRAAGYVDDLLTVEDAVHSDPLLDPVGREAVMRVYESFVSQDRRR